jgi:hypothetical protein
MSESKCFCDLYQKASAGNISKVNVGTSETVTPNEFVEDADRICPGTRVFIGNTALGAEDIIVTDESVTLPRSAVTLQCEYFVTRHPGM